MGPNTVIAGTVGFSRVGGVQSMLPRDGAPTAGGVAGVLTPATAAGRNNLSDSSDTEHEDMCASPRLQRRRKLRKRLGFF